jgi:ketosteroid isomerase-like protein
MRAFLFFGLVNMALLTACRKEAAPGPVPSGSSVAVVSAAPALPSASPGSAPAPSKKVEAFVERWQAAQNAADVAAYEKLYAKKFVGIKRVGQQVFRFDRARWLVDRKGMFAHKPQVGVQSLSVIDLGKTAVARFEQTFASGKFRDVGGKQLVLVEEDGELKIGREEMLTSLVAAPAGVVAFPDFAFVVHHGGRPFALLEKRARDTTSTIEYVDLETALALVEGDAALPSSRRGLVGREMALHGESGELCRSQVRRVVTLARAIPHFGQRQQWSGELGDPPTPKPVIARNLSDLAGSAGSYLALELEPKPACDKARWARAADRPAPAYLKRRDATTAEELGALAEFELLPVHQANQKDFALEAALKQNLPPWYRFDHAKPSVSVFEGKAHKLVAVSAEAGSGCGEYRGEGWALFSDKAGTLALESNEAFQRSFFLPRAAFDADGDGSFEVLGMDYRLLQARNGRYEVVLDVSAPDFDCGC